MILSFLEGSEEKLRQYLLHEEWGRYLSYQKFLERQEVLASHSFAQKRRQNWALKDAAGKVLSSCDTLKLDSFFEGKPGYNFVIGWVFTEKHLRGRGFASELLQKIMVHYESSESKLQSFTLYSEVGTEYYSRFGFLALPSFDRIFTAQQGLFLQKFLDPKFTIQWLSPEALFYGNAQLPPTLDRFSLNIDASLIDWHLKRDQWDGQGLGVTFGPFAGVSLQRDDKVEGILAWVTDHQAKRLQILILRAASPCLATQLLAAACEYAVQKGFTQISAWESEEFQSWDELGLKSGRVIREDNIPMIRPVLPGLKAEDWRTISRSHWN